MPKTRTALADATAISERLKSFAERHYGSQEEFWTRVGVPRTTASAWFRTENPSVPEVPSLLKFARKTNMNINWLLLGELPELHEKLAIGGEGPFLAVLESELRASELRASAEGSLEDLEEALAWGKSSKEEFDETWTGLLQCSAEVVQKAVEGVRPLYREVLTRVRLYRSLLRTITVSTELLELASEEGFVELQKCWEDFGKEMTQVVRSYDPAGQTEFNPTHDQPAGCSDDILVPLVISRRDPERTLRQLQSRPVGLFARALFAAIPLDEAPDFMGRTVPDKNAEVFEEVGPDSRPAFWKRLEDFYKVARVNISQQCLITPVGLPNS